MQELRSDDPGSRKADANEENKSQASGLHIHSSDSSTAPPSTYLPTRPSTSLERRGRAVPRGHLYDQDDPHGPAEKKRGIKNNKRTKSLIKYMYNLKQ